MSSPLRRLHEYGQSFWLDDLTRDLVRSGELGRRVQDEGLRGVTSNPKIFADAIEGSDSYEPDFSRLALSGLHPTQILERVMVQDVRDACDVLRPVFEESSGEDGLVSIEVSPRLAYDAAASLAEARRLHAAVGRPNLLIKIPGTRQGQAAIESAIFEGINVNVTLLFSIERYLEVAEAYIRGLERRVASRLPIDRVSSVASFFLSRIDVLVDERLESLRTLRPRADVLRGRVAIASAKLAYQSFRSIVSGSRWQALSTQGARPQRLLWASTGAKRPNDRDVKYIEPLIGRATVSTMPYKTAQAFNDHGVVAATLEEGIEDARDVLNGLAQVGVNLTDLTRTLVEQGVEKFVKPYESLLESIARRRSSQPDQGSRRGTG